MPVAVVIDNGSGSIKAGLATDRAPKVEFAAAVGRRGRETLVGDAAVAKCAQYPFESEVVDDWDAAEALWNCAFYNLHIEPSEHPVLLTESTTARASDREKMAEIMFEKFNAHSVFIVNDVT